MKVTVICVGKLKEKYWRDAIQEYSKRLSRYMKLEIIELVVAPRDVFYRLKGCIY